MRALALALALLHTCDARGGNLRASKDDPKISRPADPFNSLEHDIANSAVRAQASASDARSVASETSGRADSEATVVAAYTAQALASRTELQQPFLDGAVKEAEKQQGLAADGADGSEAAFNSVLLMQNEAVSNAAAYASATVSDRLSDTYTGFQEWKMAVLHDPMMEAKRASQKAVAPYRKKLDELHNKILNYQDRAKALQSQGEALQGAAAATAKFAVGLQGAGVLGPAKANMMAAHHMIYQAGTFMTNAAKLQMSASLASLAWGDLQTATTQELAKVAHRYAPDLIAPPPVFVAHGVVATS